MAADSKQTAMALLEAPANVVFGYDDRSHQTSYRQQHELNFMRNSQPMPRPPRPYIPPRHAKILPSAPLCYKVGRSSNRASYSYFGPDVGIDIAKNRSATLKEIKKTHTSDSVALCYHGQSRLPLITRTKLDYRDPIGEGARLLKYSRLCRILPGDQPIQAQESVWKNMHMDCHKNNENSRTSEAKSNYRWPTVGREECLQRFHFTR